MRKQKGLMIATIGKRSLKLVFSELVLATLMLPYQIYRVFIPKKKPGRPGGHPISKVFTKAFENKRAKRFVGVGLTIVIMLFGLMGNILAANETLATDQTILMQPESQIITQETLQKPVEGIVAQGFHGFHRAIDILAPYDTEMRPIARGRVVEVSFGRIGWGNTVVVEHEKGLKSRYAHLNQIRVIEGEVIEKELVLGTVGMTGWTTGPHLHLEIYQDGKAIDPQTVLPDFSI
ncbi:MAG: M23 family metallopeptidase [Candidatus Beckwithbacteria bacterium]